MDSILTLTMFGHTWEVEKLSFTGKILAYLAIIVISFLLIISCTIGFIVGGIVFIFGLMFRVKVGRWPSWCKVEISKPSK